MTIQIDDAGWGSPLLGTLIGAYREETGEFVAKMIPVELFQGEAFEKKEYLQGAVAAAKDVLSQLDHQADEPIVICAGSVLEGIRGYLEEAGMNWLSGKIEGPLQQKIEGRFLSALKKIGVRGATFETMTEKQGLFFWLCIKWLKGGDLNAPALPEREKIAKTGWGTYKFWGPLPYEKAKLAAKQFKTQRSRARFQEYS